MEMIEQTAIEVLKEIIDEITSDENAVCYVTDCDKEPLDIAIQTLEEIKQYRAIGTVEEFKALKEKAEPKKVIRVGEHFGFWKCNCGSVVYKSQDYCGDCGQRLSWE